MGLPTRCASLKAILDAMPGAIAEPMTGTESSEPLVMSYKVMGRMFAILSQGAEPFLILKCDPCRVGIRPTGSAKDRDWQPHQRFWISVNCDAEVEESEIRELIAQSWQQVAAGLGHEQHEVSSVSRH